MMNSICSFSYQVVLVIKNSPADVGDIRDMGLISGLGRSPGEGNGNPLQYSCLENPMDRGAWRATVHSVTQSQTRLKWFSTHTCIFNEVQRYSGKILLTLVSSPPWSASQPKCCDFFSHQWNKIWSCCTA